MIAVSAWAQEPSADGQQSPEPGEHEAPGSFGAAALPNRIFLPEENLTEGGPDWDDLEIGKFYEISAPGIYQESDEDQMRGWFIEERPHFKEYISINEHVDMLTWLDVEEKMLEEVTDSTVARAIKVYGVESVHTADITGQYLDIVGTLSGHRQKSRNFQIMKYGDKAAIYDYNNKIIRILSLEPMDKNTILQEQN